MEIVKILIVTDRPSGGYTRPVTSPPTTGPFHLGEFVKVLEDTSWHGFSIEITKAHRGSSTSADISNFNFASHNLMQYDEILMFPIARDSGSSMNLASANEVQAISDFMDAGGGVFATGDHEDLGAGLCREIPRVRSMRRWYYSAGGPDGLPAAPSGSSADRHDTTRSGFDSTYQFSDQSDNIAQEITPTFFSTGTSSNRFFEFRYPHPLLCSPDGIVRHLPDHGHEGQCEVPSNLNLSVLGKDEYPKLPGSNTRLAPVVVAKAKVIGGHDLTRNDGSQFKVPVNAKDFGVIGAYDGHRIIRNNKRLGRIVVDATWHHFFNINLIGAQPGGVDGSGGDAVKEQGFYAPLNSGQADHYKMIKHYFRNIVYWLIPAKRTKLIFTSLVQEFVHSGFFEEEFHFDHRRFDSIPIQVYFQFAHIAAAYFKSVRGNCSVLTFTGEIWREHDPLRDILDKIGPVIDPWGPGPRPRPRPQPDPVPFGFNPSLGQDELTQLMLGATIASFVLAEQQVEAKKMTPKKLLAKRTEVFEKMLPQVAEHAFSEFANVIKLRQKEQAKYLKEIEGLASIAAYKNPKKRITEKTKPRAKAKTKSKG